ncbi:MAG TPA: RNA methyltransferase [Bryobacteraceae bacterium]|jgi:TrmH family RNA methyltransferase|nr:RNA methyltransferase [Bryobacteraceae bacterium]
MPLTSTHNPLLQDIRRASREGRPTEDGLIAIEGPHLIEEALASPWRIERVFVTGESRSRYGGLLTQAGVEPTEVGARAFASMAGTETSQGILALVRPKRWRSAELFHEPALVVVLDGIQDPGNAGAMVRSAEAFGATGVGIANGGVHLANGKFLRAAAGSLFRIPFSERIDVEELRRVRIFALVAQSARRIQEANLRVPCALVVGNEAAGLSRDLLKMAEPISIPTQRVESLNAAVACSIALFEAQRQRSAR